jgi:hypothetical protein
MTFEPVEQFSQNIFVNANAIIDYPIFVLFAAIQLVAATCRVHELAVSMILAPLYIGSADLSYFQKSASYSCIRIFNNLLCSLKCLVNKKMQFKAALKRYLNTHSFSCVDEFLMLKMEL